ncbi:unnamed protein product [Aphanomyces euteiches]
MPLLRLLITRRHSNYAVWQSIGSTESSKTDANDQAISVDPTRAKNDVLNALMEANVGENEKAGETLADVLWAVSNQAERVRDDGSEQE